MNIWRRAIHARRRLVAAKAIAMDFDGVHTDNRLQLSQDGSESVLVSRDDGMGVRILTQLGLKLVIISMETNPVVQVRAKKLSLECKDGVEDKREALVEWASQNKLTLHEIIFVGNDINDLAVLSACSLGVAVRDSHPSVLKVADLRLRKLGGHGAVRELADLIQSCKRVSGVSSYIRAYLKVLLRLNAGR